MKKAGFTLVELLIVLAITVVFATIVTVSLVSQKRISDLNSATQQIVALLRQAQAKAETQANDVTWSVHFGNTTSKPFYALYQGAYTATDTTGYYPLPGDIIFTNPAAGSSTDVTFAAVSGIPNAATTIVLELVPEGTFSYITVNAAGLITYSGQYVFPLNWVPVPGNSTFGTPNFYVMQYDAKCVQTSNNTPLGAVGAAYDSGYRTYNNYTYPCTGSSSYIASTPDGFPVANLLHGTALAYCTALGAHLLTNDEWMTIAVNAASVAANWSGAAVGSGVMPRGNSDSAAAQYDGVNQYGTGYSDFTHRRTLTLSNGSVVWDFDGNVMQQVQRSSMDSGDNTNTITTPSCSSGSGWQFCQYGSSTAPYITAYNDASFSAATIGPPNASWNTSQNMGEVWTNSGAAGGSVFVRGGVWINDIAAGPFGLDLSWNTSTTDSVYVGFRCAK